MSLPLHYRSGRPDSVGSYPSLRRALMVERDGEKNRMLLVTGLDGLVELSGAKVAHHSLVGQLGVQRGARIENSSVGILVLGLGADERPWCFRDGCWTQVSFAPPFEAVLGTLVPKLPAEYRGWSETHTMVGVGGEITTVSGDLAVPGTRTTGKLDQRLRPNSGKPSLQISLRRQASLRRTGLCGTLGPDLCSDLLVVVGLSSQILRGLRRRADRCWRSSELAFAPSTIRGRLGFCSTPRKSRFFSCRITEE